MQASSGVNALLALAGGAPVAHGHGNGALDGDDASPEQAFSQLLSDFGAHADGKDAQNFTRGTLLTKGAAGALTAQEIDLKGLLAQAAGQQVVTPENAAALLQRIEAMASQTAALPAPQVEALAQLKDQLQTIVHTDTPKPLADILAALPAATDAKGEALVAHVVAALQEIKKASTDKAAADDAQTTEEAPTQDTAAMQAMSALMFSSAVAENQPETPAAPTQKKKSRDFVETVTVIEPLAFSATVAATDSKPAVDGIAATKAPRADLDQLVPPLARDETQHLPDVDLPKIGAAKIDAKAAGQAATNAGNDVATDALADAKAARNAAAPDSASAIDALYPSHGVSGHSTAAHLAPAKTVDLVSTGGLLNHAPVTEQVHVAIHQAAKDGVDRITIQLDPVDLGRVEVNMHTSKDGHTQLFFTVDKPETFDGLSRDARMLERSLQEAGIKADTGSMQFNLRQQPQPQMQSGLGGQGQQQQAPATPEDEESQHSSITGVQPSAVLARNYMLNIREGVDISA